MKNLLAIVLLFVSVGLHAQTIVPTGSAGQVTDFRGGVRVAKTLTLPKGSHDAQFPNIDTLARLQVSELDSTLEYHNGTQWKKVAESANVVPYTGATKDINAGNNNIYASAIGAGYGSLGLTTVPAWLAARNATVPNPGSTVTVFGVYNSAGVRGFYSYADETDTQYVNHRGGGNISSNSAYGNYALAKNTTGSSNVAFGYGALQENTTGIVNAAFGGYALWKNTTGTRNLALGSQALYNLTTGSFNTAVASQSGIALTTGDRNTIIGQASGESLTSGRKNTFIGRSAGTGITTGTGNIVLSHGLGVEEVPQGTYGIVTGNYNVIIGWAYGLDSNLSNNIVIADGQANKAFHKNSAGVVNLYGTSVQHNGYTLSPACTNVTAAYTTTPAITTITANGTFTITLTTASVPDGFEYTVKNTGAGAITVVVQGGGTIDGTTSKVLDTAYTGAKFTKVGTNYIVTGSF